MTLPPPERPTRVIHELKVWTEFFDALASGAKPFELRRDDRGFCVGDTLHLREFRFGDSRGYTGREVTRQVTYILRDEPTFGLMDGFVCLGLSPRRIGVARPDQRMEQGYVDARTREVETLRAQLTEQARRITEWERRNANQVGIIRQFSADLVEARAEIARLRPLVEACIRGPRSPIEPT